MPESIDSYDARILEVLQENCAISTVELAARVGLSQAPCWRRLNRLRSEGYILREVALVDRAKVGLVTEVFAHVKLSAHGRNNISEFFEATKVHAQILECHILLGTVDALLRVLVRDVHEYERFYFEHLTRLPGVQEVNSMVALGESKWTTFVPVKVQARGRAKSA